MHKRFFTALLFTSTLAFSLDARADEADEEFVAHASLEELDEAGFLIHGIEDVEAISVNANYLIDQRFSQLDRLVEHLASAGLFEELAEIEQLRDLVDLLGSYPIEDFMPAGTGQIDKSGWPSTGTDFGGAPEGGLYPSFPESGSLAGSGWTHTGTDSEGRLLWESDHTSEDGTHTHKEFVEDESGIVQSSWQVTNPNGSGYRSSSWTTEDGGTQTVNEKFDSDQEVTQREHIYTGPGEDPPPRPQDTKEVDKYQPADGSTQGVLCPLQFWQCREAAEKLAEEAEDPYRLIDGFALFNPGPEGETEQSGPRLLIDPETLVINPEAAQNDTEKMPKAIRLNIPVVVLPPKPNT